MGKIFSNKLLWLGIFIAWFNVFLFRPVGPRLIGLVLAGLWVLLLIIFYNREFYRRTWRMLGGLGLVGLSLIGMLGNRDSHFVLFGLSVGSIGLLALTYYLLSNRVREYGSVLELGLAPLISGINYLRNFLLLLFTKEIDLVKERVWFKSSARNRDVWKSLAGGFLIGLPVVVILVTLLGVGDPVFGNFLQNLLDRFGKWEDWMTRLVVSVVMGLVLFPAMIRGKGVRFVSPLSFLNKGLYGGNYLVVMVMVAVVMSVFLVVQWPYVFASVPSETDLSQFGLATYSEYVAKGFVEFLLVAGMIYGLVWGGLISLRYTFSKVKTKSEKVKAKVPFDSAQDRSATYFNDKIWDFNWLKWTQMLVLALFAIFLISVFRRIWLYQVYHGLSLVRVYGGWFLGWVSLMTVTLGLRHWLQGKWVQWEMLLGGVMLLLFGLVNVERLIALYNPPTVNGQVDHVYLVRMSADGYEGWLRAYDYAEEVLNREYGEMIGKDRRREIAYAGFVVSKLFENYEDRGYLSVSYFLRNVYSINCDDVCLRQIGLIGGEFSKLKFSELSNFDRWLGGNRSVERADLRMRSDMPLEKLQELERKFYELRRRVLNQPEEERLFEIDISVDTPLLF